MAPGVYIVHINNFRDTAMTADQEISQKLQHARFLVGITQEEAGQLVGVTRRAWAHWEDGSRMMPKSAFELFIAKISGQVRSFLPNNAPRELVVVVADDQISPVDVVSQENFLSLVHDTQTDRWIISSLAIDRFSGRKYTHRVAFSSLGNEHILKAAERWKAALIEGY